MRAPFPSVRREAERGWPSRRREATRALAILLLFLLSALAGLAPAAAQAQEHVAVTRAQVVAQRGADSGTFVDAQFDFPLSNALRDAVDHGIPLYFVIEVELSRARWYWFDKHLLSARLEYRISFSQLTRQYRLARGGLAQPFDSLDQALAALRRVSHWRVGEPELLDAGNVQARIRLRLDTSLLPKPFQVNALTDRDWALGSDWTAMAVRGEALD